MKTTDCSMCNLLLRKCVKHEMEAAAPNGIAGKVIHDDGKVKLIFKVSNQYYPHTEHNGELIDAYLHTGDTTYLDQLEGEA